MIFYFIIIILVIGKISLLESNVSLSFDQRKTKKQTNLYKITIFLKKDLSY